MATAKTKARTIKGSNLWRNWFEPLSTDCHVRFPTKRVTSNETNVCYRIAHGYSIVIFIHGINKNSTSE